jgi:hypothetical protein
MRYYLDKESEALVILLSQKSNNFFPSNGQDPRIGNLSPSADAPLRNRPCKRSCPHFVAAGLQMAGRSYPFRLTIGAQGVPGSAKAIRR